MGRKRDENVLGCREKRPAQTLAGKVLVFGLETGGSYVLHGVLVF